VLPFGKVAYVVKALVSELFNRLSYIKIFIKLDLYNIYYRICIKKGDK
jgi:hypothetical protein